MVKAVFDNLESESPKAGFTVGIDDDVTNLSLPWDPLFTIESEKTIRALFYGLGADGTVSANKNSIKIIGEDTDLYAQGFFVYDSKKSGSTTTSHLRFGPTPIHAPYLVDQANFIACHQWFFLEKVNMLKYAAPGATFLLNSIYGAGEVWNELPKPVQEEIVRKKLDLYVVDAYKVARENGMGSRINTVMQTCFFALSKVLPKDEAIAAIKKSIEKSYGKKGEAIVKQNFKAVDDTLANLHDVKEPGKVTSTVEFPPTVSAAAPDFVRAVTAPIIAGDGDSLPVSAFPVDGTYPTGTAQWEKRNIALEIPVWDEAVCIQCNKCALVCPHAAIRVKVYDPASLNGAPATFKSFEFKGPEHKGKKYTVQVAPEDCTGCSLCVEYCPAKNKSETRLKAINMKPQMPLREAERANYDFFLAIPEADRRELKPDTVKGSQFFQPLFEYSGACSGCGETPYVKLASQLFGDRMLVANATGCSSIYGGNLPTTPWTKDGAGRGPAWSNSLFEDNAEFGMGMRLTVDKHASMARELVEKLRSQIGDNLAGDILAADQTDEAGIHDQRHRVAQLKEKLKGNGSPEATPAPEPRRHAREEERLDHGRRRLGVRHRLRRPRPRARVGQERQHPGPRHRGLFEHRRPDVEVHAPLGGREVRRRRQAERRRRTSGCMAMSYGNVYVAQVAMGANDSQTVRAFIEAEAYDGPSIIIAYSHCIAHGIDMAKGMTNQKVAMESGYWPIYRYNPLLATKGENPFKLDSKPPKLRFTDFSNLETRYKMLGKSHPDAAKKLAALAQEDINTRWAALELMAKEHPSNGGGAGTGGAAGRQPAATAQAAEND